MSTNFICAITGNPIEEEPVVSVKTGHVFEKRIILKLIFIRRSFYLTFYNYNNNRHIDALGTCPITGKDLTV